MIQRQDNEFIQNIKEMKKNTAQMKQMAEALTSEEDKQSEGYKEFISEMDSVDSDIENLVSEDDKKEIKKLDEIQTYIQHLQDMINNEAVDADTKTRAQRQIYLIESSYTLDVLFKELKHAVSMKPKKLVENFIKLRSNAEKKLDANSSFMFHSAFHIEKKIKLVLPEELKGKSRLVASFIYACINTASLQPNGYSMFIYFLIKNINSFGKGYAEEPVLIENLIKLTNVL